MDDILKNIFGGGFKKSKSSGGFGSSGFGGSGFHGSGFGGFGSNGTGGFGGSYSSKGEDLHAEVTVSFDEAAFGGKKVIRLQSSNGGVQNYEVIFRQVLNPVNLSDLKEKDIRESAEVKPVTCF